MVPVNPENPRDANELPKLGSSSPWYLRGHDDSEGHDDDDDDDDDKTTNMSWRRYHDGGREE